MNLTSMRYAATYAFYHRMGEERDGKGCFKRDLLEEMR